MTRHIGYANVGCLILSNSKKAINQLTQHLILKNPLHMSELKQKKAYLKQIFLT